MYLSFNMFPGAVCHVMARWTMGPCPGDPHAALAGNAHAALAGNGEFILRRGLQTGQMPLVVGHLVGG